MSPDTPDLAERLSLLERAMAETAVALRQVERALTTMNGSLSSLLAQLDTNSAIRHQSVTWNIGLMRKDFEKALATMQDVARLLSEQYRENKENHE